MSGTTDVTLKLRLGQGAVPGRRRFNIGDDAIVLIAVRPVSGNAPVTVTGLAALYWLPGTVDHQGPAQPLEVAEISPGNWQAVVPALIPGTYVVWVGILGPVRKTTWITLDVSSNGALRLTSTGTVPWGPLEAVAAAAGASAAAFEAKRVAAAAGAEAGAAAIGQALDSMAAAAAAAVANQLKDKASKSSVEALGEQVDRKANAEAVDAIAGKVDKKADKVAVAETTDSLGRRIATLEAANPVTPPELTALTVAKALGLPVFDFSDPRNSALLTL